MVNKHKNTGVNEVYCNQFYMHCLLSTGYD